MSWNTISIKLQNITDSRMHKEGQTNVQSGFFVGFLQLCILDISRHPEYFIVAHLWFCFLLDCCIYKHSIPMLTDCSRPSLAEIRDFLCALMRHVIDQWQQSQKHHYMKPTAPQNYRTTPGHDFHPNLLCVCCSYGRITRSCLIYSLYQWCNEAQLSKLLSKLLLIQVPTHIHVSPLAMTASLLSFLI